MLDVSVGDKIILEQTGVPLEVSAITENYAFNYAYISNNTYSSIYPDQKVNVIIGNMHNPDDSDQLSEDILSHDSMLGITYSTSGGSKFSDMIGSLDFIVVIIVASGALAFVVLYNLAKHQRKRKNKRACDNKSTRFLRLGGFGVHIYREKHNFSCSRYIVGFVLGVFLEQFVIKTAEVDWVSPQICRGILLYMRSSNNTSVHFYS